MQRRTSTIVWVALVIVTLTGSVINAKAQASQCLQCDARGGACFRCQAAASGGCTCNRTSCASCQINVPCQAGQICMIRPEGIEAIRFPDWTIMEIAKAHPRMAVSLIQLNLGGGLDQWARVYTLPGRIESSEVVKWKGEAAEETNKDYFDEFKRRVTLGATPPAIEFTVKDNGPSKFIIYGKVVQSFPDDPPETELEIEMAEGQVIKWSLR